MPSRRTFLAQTAALTALAPPSKSPAQVRPAERISLNGEWQFRIDSEDANTWRTVVVLHTWQIESQLADYRGVAWYRRTFQSPPDAAQAAVRIEFEAVFHSARVAVNGTVIGEHAKKGYTAFTFPVGELLRKDGLNVVEVRVDNWFNEHMLPRGRSSDWAHDGGIYRPVSLLITPPVFLERVDIDAVPDLASGNAQLDVTAYATNRSGQSVRGVVGLRVIDDATGLTVANIAGAGTMSVKAGQTGSVRLSATIAHARLWHFDRPNLYRLEITLSSGHGFETTFGVRRFEVRDTAFYLNGERVRLMGVERMGGSNPRFGIAEPEEWI